MELDVFSDAWAAAWAKELNASDAFRVAALKWESAFALVMQPDPEAGLREPRAVYVDLAHGECRVGRAATDDDLQRATYVLSASPAVWREVLAGDLEPAGAVMTGLLDLSRGSLVGLAPWVGAARELLSAASRVQGVFPEQLT